jgi:16S rRNA (uracil1498-N3)-methyltransferase
LKDEFKFIPSPSLMARIYVSSSTLESGLRGEEFDLDFETAKKLVRVLRLTVGETFVAFDGLGGEWDCALTHVENERKNFKARATILAARETKPEGRLQLSVAQAIPKGDKMEFVLQKGTELGVAEFWPFEAERSVPRLLGDADDSERATQRTNRWRRIVEAACAQCGRSQVPIVHAIGDFAMAISYGTAGGRCFMLDEDPQAPSLREVLTKAPLFDDEAPNDEPVRVMLLIGPEGGWATREREWAERYGAESVGLGRLVLRTETAALAAAAILQWEVGDLG